MRKVAVVGAGMTKFVRRALETGKELSWHASSMALQSCEMTMDDVEAVCLGTAPDAFDGVHMSAAGQEFLHLFRVGTMSLRDYLM
jgi:acetyl-CoA C-acetyltransferase